MSAIIPPVIIPFYGHNKGLYRSFSQFYPVEFKIDEVLYNCAEQWMMASKAQLFEGNEEILQQIMMETNPALIKALGRKVKNFDEHIWNSVRYDIVVRGNYAKFSQNPQIKKLLLDTREAILVEASPMDRIWGVGLSSTNPDIKDPNKWRGRNLLGKALMEVRQDLLQNGN